MKVNNVVPGSLIVYDELLPQQKFESLNQFSQRCNYVAPPHDTDAIWIRNAPNNPDVSACIIWPQRKEHCEVLLNFQDKFALHPTGTPVDAALEAISLLACQSGIVGTRGREWVGMIASLFRYRKNHGLIWHSDDVNYTGAFIYFVHNTWEINAGGLFLYQRDTETNSDGGFIFPTPNRAILLRGGVHHGVSQISTQFTGERLTLSGFFVRPERVDELLNRAIYGNGERGGSMVGNR